MNFALGLDMPSVEQNDQNKNQHNYGQPLSPLLTLCNYIIKINKHHTNIYLGGTEINHNLHLSAF